MPCFSISLRSSSTASSLGTIVKEEFTAEGTEFQKAKNVSFHSKVGWDKEKPLKFRCAVFSSVPTGKPTADGFDPEVNLHARSSHSLGV